MPFTHFATMNFKYCLKDKSLCNIPHIKLLAVILYSTVTWSNLIDFLTKKLSITCYVMHEYQSLACPSQGLQSRLKTFSIDTIPKQSIRCLLLSPVMQ